MKTALLLAALLSGCAQIELAYWVQQEAMCDKGGVFFGMWCPKENK